MKASIEYIQSKFDEYNVSVFGGKLPPVPFKLSRAHTFLGQVSFKKKRSLFGGCRYYDFVFKISSAVDMAEPLLEDTILHEMIHYYILSNQLHDTSAHGRLFVKIMNEINDKFGRHITVSHKRTEAEITNDTQKRQHIICISYLKDGGMGITVASRSQLFMLWDRLPMFENVERCEWFLSTDPYFNRYPRARTLKIYRFSRSERDNYLCGAKRLLRNGTTFSLCSRVCAQDGQE